MSESVLHSSDMIVEAKNAFGLNLSVNGYLGTKSLPMLLAERYLVFNTRGGINKDTQNQTKKHARTTRNTQNKGNTRRGETNSMQCEVVYNTPLYPDVGKETPVMHRVLNTSISSPPSHGGLTLNTIAYLSWWGFFVCL